MKNLSQKIIEKIKQEEIKPTPRWEFILKNNFFWGAFVTSAIVGGLAFSVIFQTLLNNDWDLCMQLSGGLINFIIVTLPYFWLILVILFIGVAYINIKNTKKAYKYSLLKVVSGVILASFLLGIIFYNLGVASSFDRNVIQKLPMRYHSMIDSRVGLWQRPKDGFLSGTVGSINKNILRLEDQNNEVWEVILSEDISEIVPNFILEEDSKIKIVGKILEDNCVDKCFYAEMVRPFYGFRMMRDDNTIDKDTLEKMNLYIRKNQRIKRDYGRDGLNI